MPDYRPKEGAMGFVNHPISMFLVVLGVILFGMAVGGNSVYDNVHEVTLFGPELMGQRLGQWIFQAVGGSAAIYGLHLFAKEHQ